jgi:mannose-6-phosphate isomerase-like protein (cupin superfamily)
MGRTLDGAEARRQCRGWSGCPYAQSFKKWIGGTAKRGFFVKGASMDTPPRSYSPINFAAKLKLIPDYWQPRVVAEMNDYQFKLVRIEGDFLWHDHPETDETFIVMSGTLRIDFRDGFVEIGPGEMFVVPKGVEHKPFAETEVQMMLIEPRGTLNTGREGGERTAVNDLWI